MKIIHPQTTFYWTPSKENPIALVVMKGESRQVYTCLDSSLKNELKEIISSGTIDKRKPLGFWLYKNGFCTEGINELPIFYHRWSRQISYYSTFTTFVKAIEIQEFLLKMKVLVIGVGGIGCNSIQQLCNMGVQNYVIVDDDIIEESNLNRQVLFDHSDIGREKVVVAKEWILNKNCDATVLSLNQKYSGTSLTFSDKENVDLVIVSADNNIQAVRESVAQDFYNLKTPYAFLGYNGSYGKIGPLIFDFKNGCGCCVTNLIDLKGSLEAVSDSERFGIPPSSSSTNSLVVSIFLNEYVKSLVQKTENKLITFNVTNNKIDTKEIRRYASCKICGSSGL